MFLLWSILSRLKLNDGFPALIYWSFYDHEGNKIGKQDVQMSLICQLKMWGEFATMIEFKADSRRPVFPWERTNFFKKYFHRTSTRVSQSFLGTISFLHNLIPSKHLIHITDFYLGKVDIPQVQLESKLGN